MLVGYNVPVRGLLLVADVPAAKAAFGQDLEQLLADALSFTDRFGTLVAPKDTALRWAQRAASLRSEQVLRLVQKEESELRDSLVHGKTSGRRGEEYWFPPEQRAEWFEDDNAVLQVLRSWCGAKPQERFDVRQVGRRVLAHLAGSPSATPDGPLVLTAREIGAADLLEHGDMVVAAASVIGGPNSHASIIARSLGIPLILGIDPAVLDAPDGTEVLIDTHDATLTVHPGPLECGDALAAMHGARRRREVLATERELPCRTLDGGEVVRWQVAGQRLRREGAWLVPHVLELEVHGGSARLDYTLARLPEGGHSTLRVAVHGGSIRLTVPPGVAVDLSGIETHGGRVRDNASRHAAPGARVMHVITMTGATHGGSVIVEPLGAK